MKFYIDLGARVVILLALLSLLQGGIYNGICSIIYWVLGYNSKFIIDKKQGGGCLWIGKKAAIMGIILIQQKKKKIDIFVNVNFAIMSSPNGNKKKKKRINITDKKQGWDIFPPTTINTNIFKDFLYRKKCMCIIFSNIWNDLIIS